MQRIVVRFIPLGWPKDNSSLQANLTWIMNYKKVEATKESRQMNVVN